MLIMILYEFAMVYQTIWVKVIISSGYLFPYSFLSIFTDQRRKTSECQKLILDMSS